MVGNSWIATDRLEIMKEKDGMNIFLVGDVLVSRDCLEEYFCCDISDCHGACCIEGDAGAPVTEKEVSNIQSILPQIWDSLSVAARNEIEVCQALAYF